MFRKILIADDHYIVRLGTAIALEAYDSQIEIQFAENYAGIEKLLQAGSFDLLILDINMHGIERSVIKEIKKKCPGIKIMLFSGYSVSFALHLVREGADGYLNKQSGAENIAASIQQLYDNGYFFPPEMAYELLQHQDTPNPKEVLSEKEFEIFQLFAKGFGNLEITNLLAIQPGTVSTYKKRIFRKLNSNSVADLVKIFLNAAK